MLQPENAKKFIKTLILTIQGLQPFLH